MNIDWDKFPDDSPEQPAAMSREPLSDGVHRGTVERVTIESGWRITDDNPSGDCLSIWLDCQEGGERKRVFVTVPVSQINRITVIARACGVSPPERGRADWDETTLIGREATVETAQYIVQNGPKAGETRAAVRRWITPEAVPVAGGAAKKPPRPAVVKVGRGAAKGGSDDIPF